MSQQCNLCSLLGIVFFVTPLDPHKLWRTVETQRLRALPQVAQGVSGKSALEWCHSNADKSGIILMQISLLWRCCTSLPHWLARACTWVLLNSYHVDGYHVDGKACSRCDRKKPESGKEEEESCRSGCHLHGCSVHGDWLSGNGASLGF